MGAIEADRYRNLLAAVFCRSPFHLISSEALKAIRDPLISDEIVLMRKGRDGALFGVLWYISKRIFIGPCSYHS